jgi:hypothetical protein
LLDTPRHQPNSFEHESFSFLRHCDSKIAKFCPFIGILGGANVCGMENCAGQPTAVKTN